MVAAAMNAREEILGRVRRALADVPSAEPDSWEPAGATDAAARYQRGDSTPGSERLELFADRVGDYRARVRRCAGDEAAIGAAVAQACADHGVRTLVVPDGVPSSWIPGEVAVLGDAPPLSPAQLDAADGVLTACAAAIAPTGTIVLDAGRAQGRRVLTLVPDLHICVVAERQIVGGVPEAVRVMRAGVDARRPVTLISGPSATSDIELRRVEGVHGPRRLEVIVAAADA
jgi:L-lactate dehydrogenase complex protein LldG